MSGSKPGGYSSVVEIFAEKIHSDLADGLFSGYDSGDEVDFLDEVVEYLDGIFAYDGEETLFVKCKQVHQSPKVSSPNIRSYGKSKVELGDLMVVVNHWYDGTPRDRQGFISQTKCMKGLKPGYLWWQIDEAQFDLMENPEGFELEHKEADTTHDLRHSRPSFLNYSFVGEPHRPFFYNPGDMSEFIDSTYKKPRFNYGLNPPPGTRYLYSKLKSVVSGRYGANLRDGSDERALVEEVFEHGKLTKSSTPNRFYGPTMSPDGGQQTASFSIVNIDIDWGRSIEVGDEWSQSLDETSRETREALHETLTDEFSALHSQEEEANFYDI